MQPPVRCSSHWCVYIDQCVQHFVEKVSHYVNVIIVHLFLHADRTSSKRYKTYLMPWWCICSSNHELNHQLLGRAINYNNQCAVRLTANPANPAHKVSCSPKNMKRNLNLLNHLISVNTRNTNHRVLIHIFN